MNITWHISLTLYFFLALSGVVFTISMVKCDHPYLYLVALIAVSACTYDEDSGYPKLS